MHDVIILGAGVAGLTSARQLARAGLDVVVLEARQRLGGRTHSPTLAGAPLDLGATWVWDHEDAVLRLLSELEISVWSEPVDASLDDLYEREQVFRTQLPRSWSQERRVTGGTGSIATVLANPLPVELDQQAHAIEQQADHLIVHVGEEQRRARQVIAALPPSLLASAVAMPQLEQASRDKLKRVPVWMGDIAKVVAVYPRRFWRERGLSGRVFSHVGPMVEIHDMSVPRAGVCALFGFLPRAMAPTSNIADAAVEQLVRLYGPDAASPSSVVVTPWWGEAHTVPQGDVQPVEQLMGHAVLRRPLLDGRLWLASTETAAQNAGHIDGAVRRGWEVAEQVRVSFSR